MAAESSVIWIKGRRDFTVLPLHFGEEALPTSPPAAVAKIKAAYPEGVYHLYPAEHGFNCNDRASFEPKSAKSSPLERSLDFLKRHIG